MTVLMLAAGIVLGRLSTRVSIPLQIATPPERKGPWGLSELKLSAEQREKMDAIWNETRQAMEKTDERRRTLDDERRQAYQNLLNDEQRKAYEKIQETFRNDRDALDKERNELIKSANARTRELLDADQQKIFDEGTKRMQDRGPRGPGGRGGKPSSMPSGGQRDGSPHDGGPPDGGGPRFGPNRSGDHPKEKF